MSRNSSEQRSRNFPGRSATKVARLARPTGNRDEVNVISIEIETVSHCSLRLQDERHPIPPSDPNHARGVRVLLGKNPDLPLSSRENDAGPRCDEDQQAQESEDDRDDEVEASDQRTGGVGVDGPCLL